MPTYFFILIKQSLFSCDNTFSHCCYYCFEIMESKSGCHEKKTTKKTINKYIVKKKCSSFISKLKQILVQEREVQCVRLHLTDLSNKIGY